VRICIFGCSKGKGHPKELCPWKFPWMSHLHVDNQPPLSPWWLGFMIGV
jgi:hypothetical protein